MCSAGGNAPALMELTVHEGQASHLVKHSQSHSSVSGLSWKVQCQNVPPALTNLTLEKPTPFAFSCGIETHLFPYLVPDFSGGFVLKDHLV